MKIINESSLDYLDKLTNEGSDSQDQDVQISPAIKDIGDVGVNGTINF